MYLVCDDHDKNHEEENEDDVHSFLKSLCYLLLGQFLDKEESYENEDKEYFDVGLKGYEIGGDDPYAKGKGVIHILIVYFWFCQGGEKEQNDCDRGEDDIEYL